MQNKYVIISPSAGTIGQPESCLIYVNSEQAVSGGGYLLNFKPIAGRYTSYFTELVILSDGTYSGKITATLYTILTNSLSESFMVQLNSFYRSLIFTATAATDILNSISHGLSTGDKVRVSATIALPTGLLPDTDYFVITSDVDNFKLASSEILATNSVAIDISSNGTGTLILAKSVEV